MPSDKDILYDMSMCLSGEDCVPIFSLLKNICPYFYFCLFVWCTCFYFSCRFFISSSFFYVLFFSLLKPFVNFRKASLSLSLMANLTQVLGDHSASNSIRANEGKIKTASIPTHPGECFGPERCLSWVLRKYSQLSGDKLSMSDRHLTLAPRLASIQERPPNVTLSWLSRPSRMASANVFFQLLH